MDRSFLSQADVIAASRQFVCVRLTSYENQQEADFLKRTFVGKSGEAENTVFTILSPDGQRQLVRPDRSPRQSVGGPAQLVETMNRIARQFEARPGQGERELPKVANIRLALDVSACDHQPLAVLAAADANALRQLEERVRKLAWSQDFLGQLVYATTTNLNDLRAVEGVAQNGGLIVIQTDRYGLKGKVLAQAPANANDTDLAQTLRTGVRQYQRFDSTFENHIRSGHLAGIFWETQTPVTDPMERRAREKGRKLP